MRVGTIGVMRETPAAAAWAASGAMALTGRADGPPLRAPEGVVARMLELGAPLGIDVLAHVAERAALVGHTRHGAISCGGSARVFPTADGWLAANFARADDVAAIPAWLGLASGGASVDDVGPVVRERPTRDLVASAATLGLPIAAIGEVAPPSAPVVRTHVAGAASHTDAPLVVDLSALWAGPLCARLLAAHGARVIKVESVARPDGARSGSPSFYDAMQAHAQSVAIDFASDAGRHTLRQLVARADVVIEASRSRALRQLGIDVETVLRDGPRVWISITGYGRDCNRVAFGDDAAAAGGLVAWDDDGPVFVADAIADPLTGVAAAVAATECLRTGGRWLLDAALARVAAHVAGTDRDRPWCPAATADAAMPHTETPRRSAPALGADNARVAAEFGIDL
jgi:hypothetical protein